jgi:hypothetical protein
MNYVGPMLRTLTPNPFLPKGEGNNPIAILDFVETLTRLSQREGDLLQVLTSLTLTELGNLPKREMPLCYQSRHRDL